MESTRKPVSWFKTKPQARQDFGDPAEPRNFDGSVRHRQLCLLVRWLDETLDRRVATAVTNAGRPPGDDHALQRRSQAA
jgi:hypothetical protein